MKVCFNTEKGPKAVGPYSTLTMTNDLVFVSGMIPLDPATNEIVEGGIETQARQSLENIKTVLEEYDGTEIIAMIGPEGDFSKEEAEAALSAGFIPVHLGDSRLRTETAALTATSAAYFRYMK